MPLKSLDAANPIILEYWMQISEKGCLDKLFPDVKVAASIRTQMGRYRTLAASQARWWFNEHAHIVLKTRQDVRSGKYGIYHGDAQDLMSDDSVHAKCVYVRGQHIQPQINSVEQAARQHYHQPVSITHTGIPMVLPDVLPPIAQPSLETDEERKRREAHEENERAEAMIRKLGLGPGSSLNELYRKDSNS